MSSFTNRQGGFLISKVKQIGGRVFNAILSKQGIEAFNGEQGKILYVLWNTDAGLSMTKISELTGLAKTTLSAMIKHMKDEGLVDLRQSEKDRRILLVQLTGKTRMLKGEYDSVSEEIGSIYYRGFSEDEIADFENCLQRILHNLEEAEDNL